MLRKEPPPCPDPGIVSPSILLSKAQEAEGSKGTGKPVPPPAPFLMLRGSQAPRRAVCGTRGSLRTMHGGGSAPSCCAFIDSKNNVLNFLFFFDLFP